MSISYCVSCGKYIGNDRNHKCSPKSESAKQAAQTRALNDEVWLAYEPPKPTYNRRLREGFAMMEGRGG